MIKARIILLLLVLTAFFFTADAQRKKEKEHESEQEESNEIMERFQHEINMTKDPVLGYVPKDRLVNAWNERKIRLERIAYRAPLFTWTERGPNSDVVGASNGNTRANNGITSGRIRAILEDKSDATGKTVWVAGVDGGIWKTNDITAIPAIWNPINDYLGNLSVTSICQDPSNNNIMYFGTGEKADNADAVRGAGIWTSSDHGLSWTVMSGTAGFYKISKMLCDASGNLYVATNSGAGSPGLQRYTKATGIWDNITPTGLSTRVADIELSSTGRLHVVCGYRGSPAGHRYTDNPATITSGGWTSPVTTYTNDGINVVLASNGNILYALPSAGTSGNYEVTTIYKSTDGGAHWAATGTTPAFTSGQGWYCLGVAVDPTNANNVIVGSLDCYKTTNGGSTWTKISNWVGTSGQYVHADQQIITWRNNNQVLVGSDGGIHYSPNGGTTFTDKNTGLRIKQFYSVAIHPASTNYFLAGAQDNGTHQLNGPGLTSSVEVTGGDGAFVHIDQNQPQYQFGAYVYNQYRRSTDGGSSWSSINFSGAAGRFINPTDYDDVANIMYCSYSANTYLRWNDPQTGSSISSVSLALNGGTVSAVKVSPYTSNTVYFAGGGGSAPALLKATNANASPTVTNITGSSMTSGNINNIEVGTTENNLIVSFSNFGINNLYVSDNGGTSWTAIDGNLPDMPVRWAMFYPGDNTKAIIATESGVWQTELINGAATVWDPETGFPNVRVDMLQYRSSDRLLAASTHGRGIFTSIIPSGPTCGTVTGLTSSLITTTSATISWSALSGANNYDVDLKLASSPTWINTATATTSLQTDLIGLTPGTLYDWRVRANCTSATGSYTQAQFTTTALPSCGNVTGLSSSSITETSATISWSALSGAGNYDVDYQLSPSGGWINAATATTSTSVNLSGLTVSSLYDWRVRANCTNGLTGNYSQAQFTTATPTCGTVTGLSSSAITSSAATISWSALSGAGNYDVDYQVSPNGGWINAATGTTSTTLNLVGLTASTVYDWRVRANCTNGLTGSYSQAQLTTLAPPTCGIVTGLISSAITSSTATVSWTALSGAANYDVDYQVSLSGSWVSAATATTATTVNLAGLTASTLYVWRVRANCTNGITGNYSQAQFTTAIAGCPDIFEPNNTLATAAPISVFTNYDALIAVNGDIDYYSFYNTPEQKRIRVTLNNLPANYDLKLYKPSGSQAGSSAKSGTTPEIIIYNTSKASEVGKYKAYVFGKGGAFNATQCYRLLVELNAVNFGNEFLPDADEPGTAFSGSSQILMQGGLKLFPVPASDVVTVSFDAFGKGKADIIVLDQLGIVLLKKQAGVDKGINYYNLDLSKLLSGVYTVKVIQANDLKVQKLIIQK